MSLERRVNMKDIMKTLLVSACVVLFACLVVWASTGSFGTNSTLNPPKAPILVSYRAPESINDPTALVIELPKDHNAKSVMLYFGDELGKYDSLIGKYDVVSDVVVCEIDSNVACPLTATRIWVYTQNDQLLSDKGISIDLYGTSAIVEAEDTPAETEKVPEKYAYTVIIGALLVSTVGYIFLGNSKKSEDENEPLEANEA